MQDIIFGLFLLGLLVFGLWAVTRPMEPVTAITISNPTYSPMVRVSETEMDRRMEEAYSAEIRKFAEAFKENPGLYAATRVTRGTKEEESMSSCSAKERITEIRLRALETGQPIDTMEVVKEALEVLSAPPPLYFGGSYEAEYKLTRDMNRTAVALLRFLVERNASQPTTEQAEAVYR
jgi:hypothetical protein